MTLKILFHFSSNSTNNETISVHLYTLKYNNSGTSTSNIPFHFGPYSYLFGDHSSVISLHVYPENGLPFQTILSIISLHVFPKNSIPFGAVVGYIFHHFTPIFTQFPPMFTAKIAFHLGAYFTSIRPASGDDKWSFGRNKSATNRRTRGILARQHQQYVFICFGPCCCETTLLLFCCCKCNIGCRHGVILILF